MDLPNRIPAHVFVLMFVSLSRESLHLDGGMPVKKCILKTLVKIFGIADVSCVPNTEQTIRA